MILSIDYDDTYTRDPVMWNLFLEIALERGHKVYCVSARHGGAAMDDPKQTVGRVIGAENCFGTNGDAKQHFMFREHGIWIDVWIDDLPMAVTTPNKHHQNSAGEWVTIFDGQDSAD